MTIREFPLAWRWTNSSHALFPDDVLGNLQPLEVADARKLSKPMIASFPRETRIDAAITTEEGRAWLLEQNPNVEEQVIISWTENLAIKTTWKIFTEHWEDFCYPASDDLAVLPESNAWMLLYHHNEEFKFVGK